MRIFIVEDEPVAREALRLRLEREPDVEVVGEAGSGHEAVEAITRLLPDVVFLDIEIPPPTGFDVLQAVAPVHLPAVIFVTAYDHFAVRAFDVDALDFLLKPLDQERVQRALARARSALGAGADSAHDRLAQLLERHAELQSTASDQVAASARRRLVVRTGERYRLVPLDEVAWLESAGNYVRVHSRGRSHLLRTPLRELEKTLDPHQFVRIHRGIIVNLDVIAEVVPASHGDCDVVLSDGRRLRMSRSYRHNLLVG